MEVRISKLQVTEMTPVSSYWGMGNLASDFVQDQGVDGDGIVVVDGFQLHACDSTGFCVALTNPRNLYIDLLPLQTQPLYALLRHEVGLRTRIYKHST